MTATTTTIDNFVKLSAALTGIAADKLAPGLDPKNVKQTYFDYTARKAGALFDQLLAIYAANAAQPPATIANIVLNQSGDPIRYLARTVMLEWYLGNWYDPAVLASYHGPNPPKTPPNGVVISPLAYTQGWAWSVAQAHPMGYSNFNFGYWANNPPALSAFVGGGST
jgi:hypothetical protein